MFCSKCGYKLTENTKTCGKCGTAAEQPEYCGGFWGIVGLKPAAVPVTSAELKPDDSSKTLQKDKKAHKDAGEKKGMKRLPLILLALCAVLLILLLIQTGRIAHYQAELSNMTNKYYASQYEYNSVKNMMEEAVSGLDEIRSDVEDVKEALLSTEPEESGETEATDETEASAESEMTENVDNPEDTGTTQDEDASGETQNSEESHG